MRRPSDLDEAKRDQDRGTAMDVDTRGNWTPPAAGRWSDRVRTYSEGRVCAEPGCTTVLSVYNSSSRCSLHQRRAVVRLRRLEAEEMEHHCSQCGAPFVTANLRRKYCSPRCRSHAFAAREKAMRRALQMESGERRAA
jgi:endogenous inhibitor of DNA gyrase (YacG/DUF329 family)